VRRRLVIPLTILPLLALTPPAIPADAPSTHVEVHGSDDTTTVDNVAWAAFLARYVRTRADGLSLVAYGNVTAADRQSLERYVTSLEETPISRCQRPEQLAFWINLYNALVVRLVLQHYPVASVRDIGGSPGSPATDPWKEKIAHVEGQALSLDDIAQGILVPVWHDPRTLYALSCAAISCPSLRARPYSASRIDKELDAAAMAYVNSPRGVRILGRRLIVSRLYEWHEAQFGGTEGGIIRHLLAYAAPDLAMTLQQINHIDGFQFDWALNGTR
jgi:hypothetical protein